MPTWNAFEREQPSLAELAASRLAGNVAYLATTRSDGAPRVHPVTPIIGNGILFVFMEPTSPKGHNLRRDGRFALHSAVADSQGTGGEFVVFGRARGVEDPAERAKAAAAASYPPAEHYVLFELLPEEVLATEYAGDVPRRRRWRATRG